MKITSKQQLFKQCEARREKLKISPNALAKTAGFSQSTWSLIQSDKRVPSWDVLIKAVKALGMNIEITLKK